MSEVLRRALLEIEDLTDGADIHDARTAKVRSIAAVALENFKGERPAGPGQCQPTLTDQAAARKRIAELQPPTSNLAPITLLDYYTLLGLVAGFAPAEDKAEVQATLDRITAAVRSRQAQVEG